MAELRSYLVGWKAYVCLADTASVFQALDGWLNRRRRMLIVKQSKRGTTLFRLLRTRNISTRLAAAAAAHYRCWWATAKHGALHTAFPKQYFSALGVPRLGPS